MSDWANEQIEYNDEKMRQASGRVQDARRYGSIDSAAQGQVQSASENANRWRRVRNQQQRAAGPYAQRWTTRRWSR